MTRNALGRGLGALIREPEPQVPAPPTPAVQPHATSTNSAAAAAPARETVHAGPLQIDIDLIEPSPYQPRTRFREEALDELARSIQSSGIIQPLVLRPIGSRFQLIAGERRWRAAQRAGLTKVSAIVRQVPDELALEMTLVENIQREDLNPIETAQALERLAREMNLSHEEIASRTGKDRTTITNMIRLLRLPSDVQLLVAERRLSMGHARAILGLAKPEHQTQLAEKAAAQGFSVRQVERLVKKINEPRDPSETPLQDPNIRAAVADLESALGTRVRIIEKSDQRGRIEIDYFSQEDLQRVYELILPTTRKE